VSPKNHCLRIREVDMKRTAAWLIIFLVMAIGTGCATPGSDITYGKVVQENPAMGGASDNNPNWRK